MHFLKIFAGILCIGQCLAFRVPINFAARVSAATNNNTLGIAYAAVGEDARLLWTDDQDSGPVGEDNRLTPEENVDSSENTIFVGGMNELLEQRDIEHIKTLMLTDPKTKMTVPELVRYCGYGAEIHHVTTEDGYILELHRVLAKQKNKRCSNSKKRTHCQPVLLQHGLLGSSSAWVMNDPNKAIAYIMADKGYDVWMGNARGNIYSMNHTTLDVNSKEFWDFSFDEMGKYDIPAVINFILRSTKHKKLHYVGHSMGTTMFWVLENTRPGFTESRVASMSALGPVAYVGQAKSPIVLIAPFSKKIYWVLTKLFHAYRLFNPNSLISKFTAGVCSVLKFSELICSNMSFLLIGFDGKDLDLNWLPMILTHLNAGTSTKTLEHFAQLINTSKFSMFDYDSSTNMQRYNQSTPPVYDLAKVHVPVLLKWGPNDWLADPTDVSHLKKELTNCQAINSPVKNPDFNHLDFLWGKDAAKVVYQDVFNFMSKHKI